MKVVENNVKTLKTAFTIDDILKDLRERYNVAYPESQVTIEDALLILRDSEGGTSYFVQGLKDVSITQLLGSIELAKSMITMEHFMTVDIEVGE